MFNIYKSFKYLILKKNDFCLIDQAICTLNCL